MLIKGHNLKDETVLAVGEFTLMWDWFERTWFNSKSCNPQKLKEKANSIHIDSQALNHFACVLRQRRDRFGCDTTTYVARKMHPVGARKFSDEDKAIICEFMDQTGSEQTRGCLLAVLRIRNNLMHGLKILDELDNQLELLRAATKVLESIDEN